MMKFKKYVHWPMSLVERDTTVQSRGQEDVLSYYNVLSLRWFSWKLRRDPRSLDESRSISSEFPNFTKINYFANNSNQNQHSRRGLFISHSVRGRCEMGAHWWRPNSLRLIIKQRQIININSIQLELWRREINTPSKWEGSRFPKCPRRWRK